MALLSKRSNRHLLITLCRAKLQAHEYNSFFGMSWSILGPLAMWLAMYLVFQHRFADRIKDYPLYLLLGIVCVNFFITSTNHILRTLSLERELVLNTSVPREFVILANLFLHSCKLLIEVGLCCLFSACLGQLPVDRILLIVPVLLSLLGVTVGTGIVLCLAYCMVRDTEHIWGLCARLLLFVTPVFYSLEDLGPLIRDLVYWVNPLTPIMEALRNCILKTAEFQPMIYLHAAVLGAVFFLLGYGAFLALEGRAVERV